MWIGKACRRLQRSAAVAAARCKVRDAWHSHAEHIHRRRSVRDLSLTFLSACDGVQCCKEMRRKCCWAHGNRLRVLKALLQFLLPPCTMPMLLLRWTQHRSPARHGL